MEEIRPTFGAVAKELQDFIYNEIDAITESDWFAEKLDNKVAIAIGEKETPLRVDVNYVGRTDNQPNKGRQGYSAYAGRLSFSI